MALLRLLLLGVPFFAILLSVSPCDTCRGGETMVQTLSSQTHKGKASYYARKFTGGRTASGARLHHDSMTCAHRTYPFGTMLRVKNPGNGKEVVVKVTDRGPFVKGRIIDLTWRAAYELGITRQGVAMVEVSVVNDATIPYQAEEKLDIPSFELDLVMPEYDFLEDMRMMELEKVKEQHQNSPIVVP